MSELTVGLDIGSSALKACSFDLSGDGLPNLEKVKSVSTGLKRARPGWAEHDLKATERALRKLLGDLPTNCSVGFTSAMHALVLLDEAGEPICDGISWADLRSIEHSQYLKELDPASHARTGTPIHPMAWPAKLLWVREERPDWWKRIHRITDLKGYLMGRLLERAVPLDISSASSTGLWNQDTETWDQALCLHLELETDRLPSVALERSSVCQGDRTFFYGAGDGPLGNLGVGAVVAGRVAISLGTSGAVRQMESEIGKDLPSSLFRYALDRHNYVRGGAISNGTSVLEWLQKLKDRTVEEVVQDAAQCGPGASGITVYPYFSGERSPFWKPDVESRILGWSFEHDFHHLARACLEGVAFCLKRLLMELNPPGEPLRCTGGFFASPFWKQLLADVTGIPVSISPIEEATALGAALLTTDDYLERAATFPVGEVTEPRSDKVKIYEELFEKWSRADSTLILHS
jgi:gluconokinase